MITKLRSMLDMYGGGGLIIGLILIIGTLIAYSYIHSGSLFDINTIQSLFSKVTQDPIGYALFVWFGIIIGHFIWRQMT